MNHLVRFRSLLVLLALLIAPLPALAGGPGSSAQSTRAQPSTNSTFLQKVGARLTGGVSTQERRMTNAYDKRDQQLAKADAFRSVGGAKIDAAASTRNAASGRNVFVRTFANRKAEKLENSAHKDFKTANKADDKAVKANATGFKAESRFATLTDQRFPRYTTDKPQSVAAAKQAKQAVRGERISRVVNGAGAVASAAIAGAGVVTGNPAAALGGAVGVGINGKMHSEFKKNAVAAKANARAALRADMHAERVEAWRQAEGSAF